MDKLINELVRLWFKWLENDKRARDINLKIFKRRKAAENCEKIVNEKYKVIARIDKYINEYKRT